MYGAFLEKRFAAPAALIQQEIVWSVRITGGGFLDMATKELDRLFRNKWRLKPGLEDAKAAALEHVMNGQIF